jgi:GH15 family glucan-1,4-alpha-glucosidase
LREYHIQNYREEIGKIIEHANTELKYERVFKSIKDEWEKHDLKIIPFKESMDSYILVQTETLTTSIEENLTTLETVA